jgi:hypothetical protein
MPRIALPPLSKLIVGADTAKLLLPDATAPLGAVQKFDPLSTDLGEDLLLAD